MDKHISRPLATALLVLALVACQVTSTPTPTPASAPAATFTLTCIATPEATSMGARGPTSIASPASNVIPETPTALLATTPTSIVVVPTLSLPTTLPTASSLTGTVVGRMYFPSQYIPAMNLFYQRIGTQEVVTVPIAAGQQFYTVTLPEGQYHAYAWLLDFGFSGAHTACTATNACDDHTLRTVVVSARTIMTGVDIVDWYAPFGTFPMPPGAKRVGTLRGTIRYPYSDIPPMIVFARNNETGETLRVTTQRGQSTFQFDEIPVGGYYLFAWTQDENGQPFGGAYTCWKLAPSYCTDHGLVTAVVRYHDITTEIINDWSDQTIVPQP
jgi:hypothetical protein